MHKRHWQCGFVVGMVLLTVCGSAAAQVVSQTLQAEYRFNVGAGASSFSYNGVANQWAVSYETGNDIGFYNAGGSYLSSITPDLSLLTALYEGMSQPHVLDVHYFTGAGESCMFLVGNPSATLPQTAGGGGDTYSGTAYIGSVMASGGAVTYMNVGLETHNQPVQLARYVMAENGVGSFRMERAGLDQTGRYLVPTNWFSDGATAYSQIDLAAIAGVGLARSVMFDFVGLDYVLLHEDRITIIRNPTDFVWQGEVGEINSGWDEIGQVPFDEIGSLLASYSIEGLPAGASLVDIDQIGLVSPDHPSYGHYFVLDANGNVYELVPEPATMGLLAVGLVGLLARRRRTAR